MTSFTPAPTGQVTPASTDTAAQAQTAPANVLLTQAGGFVPPGAVQRIGADAAGRLMVNSVDPLIQLIGEIRVLQLLLVMGLNVNEADVDQLRAEALAELSQDYIATN